MRNKSILNFLILTVSLCVAFNTIAMGQIVSDPPKETNPMAAPDVAALNPRVFTTRLSGANEVPANASAATGFGRIVLNDAETSITASFYWNGLGTGTTAGHIHGPGAVGVNAPVLFDMTPTTGVTSGSVIDRTFAVTPTQVTQLRSGLFYFNIHTTGFSGGEIRGQLAPIVASADYDGDAKTDFGVVRAGSGGRPNQDAWYIKINGSSSEIRRDWGLTTDSIAAADYDGDGKTDIAVWRQFTAVPAFYILRSSDNTFTIIPFGSPGDRPIPADYTGDGKADPAVFRSGTTSTFWYQPSSGPFLGSPVAVPWGGSLDSTDIPAPGDYNGDGKADFCDVTAVGGIDAFNIRYGTDSVAAGPPNTVTYFGRSATDAVVLGDYDGDGKSDIAVTRPEGGQIVWYYLPSSGGQYQRIVWGLSASDLQVPGDYDGDGKTDVAVWRTSSTPAAFYVLGTTSGFIFQQYGNGSTDTPVNFDVIQ